MSTDTITGLEGEAQPRQQLLALFDEHYNPFVTLGHRLGPDALNVVLEELGGQKPHIPQPQNFWSGLEREVRDEQIRGQFRGNNYVELADEYGLSERQIRQIVDSQRREYKRAPETTKAVHVPNELYGDFEALTRRYGGVSMRELMAVALKASLAAPEVHKALREKFGEQTELQVVNG